MKIGVGLGSNLGDSRATLEAAFDFLRSLDKAVLVSSLYASEPVDCPPGSPPFLNAAAVMEYSDGVMYLLEQFQSYEKKLGRPPERSRNAPRPLDLDILFAADLEMQTSRLVLPHPRMTGRLFVLEPLAEIAPGQVIAGTGRTVLEWLQQCRETAKDQTCRRIG